MPLIRISQRDLDALAAHVRLASEDERNEVLDKMRANERSKQGARARLQYAVKKGKIKKKPCTICRSARAEAHHFDYSRPLDVVWLCKKHHEELHHDIFILHSGNRRSHI